MQTPATALSISLIAVIIAIVSILSPAAIDLITGQDIDLFSDNLSREESFEMAASASTSKLNVLSLNCWGLKFVSKLRKERLHAIGTYLANLPNLDIVGLQEIWVREDYDDVRLQVEKTLGYSKFFNAGVFGAGLAIFSRFPIVETSYFPYSLNGKPQYFWHGDYFVGKGLASAVVKHPTLGEVEVFNTHVRLIMSHFSTKS